MGIDLSANPAEVLGKAKYHANKKQFLSQLADEPALPTNAIYLDGKKTKTLVTEEYEDEERMTEQVLDHYVVTDATRTLYLGEFEPKSGTGEDIG